MVMQNMCFINIQYVNNRHAKVIVRIGSYTEVLPVFLVLVNCKNPDVIFI